MADSGSENVNEVVDSYLDGSVIKRVLAQVEVVESSSMIEAFWRSLRHQWLYLSELETMGGLEPLVEFTGAQATSSITTCPSSSRGGGLARLPSRYSRSRRSNSTRLPS